MNKAESASKLDFIIKDSDGTIAFSKSFLFTGIQAGKVLIDIPNPKLWNLKSPHLYTLETTLWNAKNVEVDNLVERFGVRIVRFNEQGFFLNDEFIKLRGLNRHQSYPYVGYAMPLSMQYLDAKILKQELCVNIIRTSHYPQSKHFLSACDELGLLVFTEIPGWQHIGSDAWQRVLLKNTEEMVLAQYNHPSVVIWGVRVNESEDNHNLYAETNAIVRRYDGMRPTSGVRNFAFSELLEDVYSYNDFKHNGHNKGIEKKTHIVKKGTPYLITEHNGHMFPVKRYDNSDVRVSQALRHATVINATNQATEVGGCIGWCMADYNTHREFGSGDHVCYHGVMDMFRLPKLAAAVYASQQTQRPYLELSSALVIGDSPQMARPPIYAFTNCDAVSLFRNERFIARFTRDGKHFPHMFQPPIVIDDFVGDQIHSQEEFHPNDATRLKKVLSRIATHGQQGLRIQDKIRAAWVMFRYHLSYKDAELLFLKYFSNMRKDTGPSYFRFVGYREGEPVIERKYGLSHLTSLSLMTERNDLWEENTYDVLRIVVSALDEFNEEMVYCNDIIEINTIGPIEIIGPRTLSLLGGSTAFYIRSIGIKGEAEIIVSHQRLGQKKLQIQVRRLGDLS
jgi:beta-galactosidase